MNRFIKLAKNFGACRKFAVKSGATMREVSQAPNPQKPQNEFKCQNRSYR
jgi:hypothetical protein